MIVRIEETQEVKELQYLSNGICCAADIIGVNGDEHFEYMETEDFCGWEAGQENYDWWKAYFTNLEEAESAKSTVVEILRDQDDCQKEQEFEDDLNDACHCDIGDQPAAMIRVCEEWAEQLK